MEPPYHNNIMSEKTIKHTYNKDNMVYSEFGRTIGMVPFLEQDYAMKTCRDWTNTKCQNASEIIPMLEKYAKLRTMEKNFGMKIPEKDKEGYDHIEKYRRKGIEFWKEVLRKPYCSPSMGELVLFSTFHYSIYNMNKTITKKSEGVESVLYNDALTRIELKDGRDEIQNIEFIKHYKKTIDPEFERIQRMALKQATSHYNWTRWYDFW